MRKTLIQTIYPSALLSEALAEMKPQTLYLNLEIDDDGSWLISDTISLTWGVGDDPLLAFRDYLISLVKWCQSLETDANEYEPDKAMLESVPVQTRIKPIVEKLRQDKCPICGQPEILHEIITECPDGD